MPILEWLNKNEASKTADKLPFRLMDEDSDYSYGSDDNQNMLIQGDNLDALKSLIPTFAGRIKCVYIDPPYNTGNAFEHYDDGLEHSLWLSLMKPRIELLHRLLAEDGSIWISIDDDECHYLKVLCDEVFGRKNFVNNVIWQKKYSVQSDSKWLSDSHDHILCYAKNKEIWRPLLLPRTEKQNSLYKHDDGDGRGVWRTDNVLVKTFSETGVFPIKNPNTGEDHLPPKGSCYRFSVQTAKKLIEENRLYFGKDGKGRPQLKRYLSGVKQGITVNTLWLREEVGDNQDAKYEIKSIFPDDFFTTPKPERLIQRILTLATKEGDWVLDSFLGSGTTAAVAHKMNRKWIGIEMGEHAITHCVPRLQKVIDGEQGGISESVQWKGGGGFLFYRLGETIFLPDGSINPKVKFKTLASHIWFSETNTPLKKIPKNPLLGIHDDTAYYLLFNGILGDKRPEGGNVLTTAVLRELQKHSGPKIIYGETTRLSRETLKRFNIVFKQIPYDVRAH